ncbi:hypothetical protein EG68_02967 [Paragonimus skrjabini miyazakii]|uniref:Uncharacterized protein n=1 Tax=Paragonimus skrjabini miyazakii TaxID=59628 RepID=A0A8S9YYK0_9TREM|nr:hypothetical protein EG68_02967 [Paragonimus skrjabini miyazakii]
MVAAIGDLEIHAVARKRLREHTKMDEELQQLKQYISTGWPSVKNITNELKCYYPLSQELSVIDDCIMRGSRFVSPLSLKRDIMLCAHEGHPGIIRTFRRASEWY